MAIFPALQKLTHMISESHIDTKKERKLFNSKYFETTTFRGTKPEGRANQAARLVVINRLESNVFA